MQPEDSPEKSFEAQMSAIISAFVIDFPNKLQSPSERKLIIESVSYLLRNEERMCELIEYDINKSPSHSLSLASQPQEESEEASASHHNQSKDFSKGQINMIHLSEHYEDSIFKHNYASSHSSDERDMETTLMPHTNDSLTLSADLALRRTERERRLRDFEDMIKIEESPPLYRHQSFSQAEKKSRAKDATKRMKLPKGRKPEFPELQRLIVVWIYSELSQGNRVTQVDIRTQAKSLVKLLPRSKGSKFKASKGWMQKFLRRHCDISGLLSLHNRKRKTRYDEKDVKVEDEQVSE